MLRIVLGEELYGVRENLLGSVCRGMESEVRGQLVIVPEQYSHEMERALCAAGGDRINLYAEVLSFSRLAGRVFACCGGISKKTLDKGGQLLAMSLAMERISSRLKRYGASRKKPEFLLRMQEVLDEFKSAGIRAGQLRQAAEEAGGQLAAKLEEMAWILESYDGVCDGLGQDANDRLTLLKEQLEQYDYAAGRRIFVLGFSDFTGLELSVIEALLQNAAEVTVGLLGDGRGNGPFSLFSDTAAQLLALAKRDGIPCETQVLPEDLSRPADLRHLCRHLFSGALRQWPEPPAALALHRSKSVYDACMETAGRIQALAAGGWRYREIGVCCLLEAEYRPVLEAVFERFGIPLYISGSDDMASDPVVGMVNAALQAATGGLEQEDVLQYMKSGLSRLDPEVCDRVENYVRAWKIRGKKWEQVWDMPPGGYGAPLDQAAREVLKQLNAARVSGIEPLASLRDGLRAAKDTGQQILALYDFFERIDLAHTLEALQERCSDEAELRQAQAYGQMYEILCGAMEQMYLVLGDTVRDPVDFSGLFAAVVGQYTVGTIPANLDSVRAGGPAAMRFGSFRALFLLGAEEGAFPACQSETSLLTELDRRKLHSLGIGVAPGRSVQMDRQIGILYQMLTSVTEHLFVGCCSEQPSYLFERMVQLFPEAVVETDAELPEILFYSADALGALSAAGAVPLETLRDTAGTAAVEAAGAIRGCAGYRMGELDNASVQRLYGEKLYLSASRTDQYAACRCAYFLRYGLRLKAQKEVSFDAPAYGTFVHAILEQTGRRVQEEGGFHAVSEARLLEIARENMAAYHDDSLEEMVRQSQRVAYLYRRNQEEVLEVVRELGRELRTSSFEPAGFEVEFSLTGSMAPVEIQGEHAKAELSGFVDRVDLFTCQGVTYVRVIDYKTGQKAFDYLDLLNGIGMQMLIYLFALEDHGQEAFGRPLRPAGVLYFPARRPILSVSGRNATAEIEKKRRAEQIRQGLLSNDQTVLHAMEQFEETPVYMPFQVNRQGEVTGDVADDSRFRLLREHVQKTLAKMADGIAAGGVEPNPIVRGSENSACTYCDYAEVCHRASGELNERPMRKADRKDFWMQLGKEAAQNG